MKKLIGIFIGIVLGAGLLAQSPTNFIKITLNKNLLLGSYNLYKVDTIYIHSGLGTTSATAVTWDHVVGNWGKPNGIGLMTKENDSIWSICIEITDYYTRLAQPDSLNGGVGLGPMPAGATPYNINCVFRNPGPCSKLDCKKGADFNGKDIYITDLQSGVPAVIDETNLSTFDAVTAVFMTSCGGGGTNAVSQLSTDAIGVTTSPNPFSDKVKLQFNTPAGSISQAVIYDVTGQKVRTLGTYTAGYHETVWTGTDASNCELPTGIYMLTITDGTHYTSHKLIKQ
jgi:Secretion system C-terminal sorting domain